MLCHLIIGLSYLVALAGTGFALLIIGRKDGF